MKNKRLIVFLIVALCFVMLAPVGVAFASNEPREITVFSWEDYIDLGYEDLSEVSDVLLDRYEEDELQTSILDLFEEKTGIKVNYYTFATNEEMYNELLKNPSAVDLICPSEYMILKMLDEDLIKPYTVPKNYIKNGSPYIKSVFDELGLNTPDGNTYAVGYMWGTMGVLYSADAYSDEDFTHWSNLFDEKFKGKLTIKDSLRDSYIMAVAMVYEEELLSLKSDFEGGDITKDAYNDKLFEIFNRVDKETVDGVLDKLIQLKGNLYGFEVDAGKSDILTGKIDANYAWSGDAVCTMWDGDDVGKELRYAVPEEGSNVWFDGWVMTKDANEDLAGEFLDFLSSSEIAIRNMEYNGYTSCVGGDELFSYVKDNFDDGEGEYFTDLKYFFDPTCTDNRYVIQTLETGRHLYAQYANEETIARCAVMDNFSIEALELVNEMWNKVKLITFSDLTIILIVVVIVLTIALLCCIKWKDKIFKKDISQKDRRIKKGVKIVSIKERER